MVWTQKTEHRYGSSEITVPPAAVLQCFVSYHGIAQHFAWVSDPTTTQNPKRAVYNKFDEKLEVLNDLLTKSGTRGNNARNLETGIAWLLWMLGFSVAHLGGTGRTQDAADLIATTPKGHFAVIECTTGVLRMDKLSLLAGRAEQVKSGIVASNNQHLRVLPIIVTSKSRSEVAVEIEQAVRLGILALTGENLAGAIDRTLVLPNADKMYDDAWSELELARTTQDAQGVLALSAAGADTEM
jgi:hypothetical protein